MGVRRVLILAGATSAIVLSFTSVAGAQGITGGCTATVNGRSPESMTEDSPLVVSKDEQVSLSGQVPPSVAPAGKQIRSTTDVYVDMFGFPVKIRTATGKGATWGGNVELPKLVRDLATGVYRVSGDATGTPGSWKCSGSAYIKLEGNALTKPATYVGAGVGLAGAAVGLKGKKGKPKPSDKNREGRMIVEMIKDLGKDVPADLRADFVMLIIALLVLLLSGTGYFPAATVPAAAMSSPGVVWVRGRPILGLIGGLFFGLGSLIVLQQFGLMALDRGALYAMLLLAALVAVRAWWGTPYRPAAAPAAPAAPPAPVAPTPSA